MHERKNEWMNESMNKMHIYIHKSVCDACKLPHKNVHVHSVRWTDLPNAQGSFLGTSPFLRVRLAFPHFTTLLTEAEDMGRNSAVYLCVVQ